jgi:hypothetical protein
MQNKRSDKTRAENNEIENRKFIEKNYQNKY